MIYDWLPAAINEGKISYFMMARGKWKSEAIWGCDSVSWAAWSINVDWDYVVVGIRALAVIGTEWAGGAEA